MEIPVPREIKITNNAEQVTVKLSATMDVT